MAELKDNSRKRISKPLKDNEGISRREALKTIGVMSAGISFLKIPENEICPPAFNAGLRPDALRQDPILAEAISQLEYLTPAKKFIVQRRGNPVLPELPEELLPSIGLSQETWRLEIISDPESDSELGNPFTIENNNALTWSGLMKMAEKHAVSYLHVLSCTNAPKPYGMGLWEGVPLREVLWQTKPGRNIRRIRFSGYHNNDPKQIFQSSLPINRVLEEIPGELPVILAYKLNGQYFSHANGGPVRLFVPGFYGNRSIKWLQKIVLTNNHQANDTYADWNNDVESPVKTCAKFIKVPAEVRTKQMFAFTGMAQVGLLGLSKVQYCIMPADEPPDANDPYLALADWRDAMILPPPANWGSDLPGGKLPGNLMQIDSKTGKLVSWPLPNTIVHWAASAKIDIPGKYDLRCRTIDANGTAQPMPRPFGRSGVNAIEAAKITANS
ncbi:MAG: molybdopterin-dependent oxidoreductase [Bacteroidales bacterium]|nr:molybdopterin-dependent oxidoreductase [Bacteroidales bacterium]HPM18905.1 molybdopterin-dependent oxidoreductase [Bacteroidales bacterium]